MILAVPGKPGPYSPLQIFKAEFFKTLGHPVRIGILEKLVQGERSVQDLQQALGLEQPIVSQHLAALRAKNVVKARKEGTTVRYTIRVASIGELLAIARQIVDSQLIDSQTMLRELRREGRRR
jgi:ArsR family transcriptional regulator